tara:strand:+ start:4364 stop:4927 length:564 start_codon:yes stop_codon:yes gene_type:complete
MSNLLVQNIKHTNGTTAETISSSGEVEQPQMTVAMFHKTSTETVTGNKSPITDLTDSNGSRGFASRGPQPSNSSGVLTLPSTGLWRVDCIFGMYTANSYSYLYGQAKFSTDSGGSFNTGCIGYQELAQNNAGGISTTYTHINTFSVFNCTDASTFRIRFDCGGDGSNFVLRDGGHTQFLLTKLGASQ